MAGTIDENGVDEDGHIYGFRRKRPSFDPRTPDEGESVPMPTEPVEPEE